MMKYYFPLNSTFETTEFCFFYLKVIPWLIGYWISTTTKEGFLFAGQKFRFDWCSWNFFCPSTQNGNVWDILDKIYLWIIFFREPQTKDISPAETKKYQNESWGITRRKTELKGYYLEWTVSKIDLKELTLKVFFLRKRQFWFKIIATVINFMDITGQYKNSRNLSVFQRVSEVPGDQTLVSILIIILNHNGN